MTGLEGSGDINAASKAQEIWNVSLLPDPFLGAVFFGMAAGPDGNLVLTSSGSDANGVFADRARTAVFYSPFVASVPLPTALPLLLAGLGVLGALRHRG